MSSGPAGGWWSDVFGIRAYSLGLGLSLGGMLLVVALIPERGSTQSPDLKYRAFAPLVASDPAAIEPPPTDPPADPEPTPPPPNSYNLIDEALGKSQITAEQAAIYRVFATFADPRLPATFRADGRLPDSEDLFADVASFSPLTQSVLAPFALRPDHPDSWWYTTDAGTLAASGGSAGEVGSAARPAGPWSSVAGGKVRVHYPPGAANLAAQAAATRDEAERFIWPELHRLLDREPLPDCANSCGNFGGDSLYDIYLANLNVAGRVKLESPRNCSGPWATYMMLDPSSSFGVLAHELMHSFVSSFGVAGGCSEYDWLDEATADWAIDFVYEELYNDDQHQELPEFLDNPRLRLESTRDEHEYGASIFFFYLTRVGGVAEEVVKKIWEKAGSYTDSLKAVNDSIPDGFATHWPEFVKYNYNREPVDEYEILDEVSDYAALESGFDPKSVSVNPDDQVELDSPQLVHLSSAYYAFKFDDTVSTLAFLNGFTYELKIENIAGAEVFTQTELDANVPVRKHGRVQALIKRVGQDWVVEDWSNKPYSIFCLDDPGDRVEALVVILSNSDHDRNSLPIEPVNLSPRLWASNMGCYQWQGTATVSSDNENVTASATWDRIQASTVPGPLPGPGGVASRYGVAGLNYKLSAGSVTFTGKCTRVFGFAELPAARNQFFTANFIPAGNLHRGYTGAGFTPELRCAPDEPLLPRVWLAMGPQSSQNVEVSADGKHMSGTVEGITWNFTAIRPP